MTTVNKFIFKVQKRLAKQGGVLCNTCKKEKTAHSSGMCDKCRYECYWD